MHDLQYIYKKPEILIKIKFSPQQMKKKIINKNKTFLKEMA